MVYGGPLNRTTVAESVRLKASGLKKLHIQLARDIDFVNLRIKKYYDNHHREGPDLKEGEKVYLLRRNIKTKRPSNKLDYLRLGPFKIEEKLGLVNYRLKLPESMQKLHTVFHISLLEPAPDNAELATNVELEDTEDEYKVERILSDRWYNNQQQLLVK